MRFFWHFFKSNIKYNKLELAISYGVSALVFLAFFYLNDKKEAINGETLISVAFYALLYAFFSNKKKFNLKYLISLPLSKARLLLVKSASDVVFFLPAMSLAFFGARHSELGFDSLALSVLLFQIAVMVTFFLFDSDIEQPRLENTRASFVNRLVYLRKMVDSGFFLTIGVGICAGIYVLPVSMALKQYVYIIFLTIVLAFKFHKSLKLMQDESLSYFMFKRDTLKMGWKLGLAATPVVMLMILGVEGIYPDKYGKHEIFKIIRSRNVESLSVFLKEKGKASPNVKAENGFTPSLAAILEGKVEALELLMGAGHEISWTPGITDKRYKGFLPPHLAAASNSPEMMRKILNLNSHAIDLPLEETKETPLLVAARNCNNEMVDFLLGNGANPDVQNAQGETPLMASVKRGCDTSTAMLLERDASTELKDSDGKVALQHMSERDTMYYFLKRKTPEIIEGQEKSSEVNRGIASEK